MNPGKMDTRITFQRNTAANVRDSLGGKIPEVWEDEFSCWAKKEKNKPGLQEFTGQNVNYINVTFTIRKPCKDIDTSMRILQDNKVYKILGMVNLETVPEYYEVYALLLEAGG